MIEKITINKNKQEKKPISPREQPSKLEKTGKDVFHGSLKNIENPEKVVREVMLKFLTEKKVLTKKEASLLSSEKINELIIRTAHEYKNIPQKIPQANIDKARRILGLQPTLGEGKIDTSKRNEEVKKLIEEMRNYLKKFKNQCPEVIGMILFGSRMDPNKLPAPNSDVDTVLILEKGTNTNPLTLEGETLLYKLRNFSDKTLTESDFPVELDELYSNDELLAKLKDPKDKRKLTWGWNSKIVKYIGDSIDDLTEIEVQIKILESINNPDIIKIKKKKIKKATELIGDYFKQTKIKKHTII